MSFWELLLWHWHDYEQCLGGIQSKESHASFELVVSLTDHNITTTIDYKQSEESFKMVYMYYE